MPIYEFQCECGLCFDAWATRANREKPQPCPNCGAQCALTVPSTVGGHFNHEVEGPGPQNTGIQDLDAHIDRVIGQHSKQGWQVADKRHADKVQLLKDTGADGNDLSRNPDGSYRVMKPEEVVKHKLAKQERAIKPEDSR